ncbi:Programmed cell death toxin MazF [hydrothermal vent metagenome]|uniref:Programmed cell death toxin MazF n=1 Tax=hydrothermal vent metagenome TaxID=652676 RepID=A0A3B1CMA3_9ZZZZ
MVIRRKYFPERGDIIWIQLNPQAGREQAGHRPALVLSPSAYNRKTGLLLACPVTSKVKGYPFEVNLPPDLEVNGVILADQVKNLDWKIREAKFGCRAPRDVVEETLNKASTLLS